MKCLTYVNSYQDTRDTTEEQSTLITRVLLYKASKWMCPFEDCKSKNIKTETSYIHINIKMTLESITIDSHNDTVTYVMTHRLN